MRFCKVRLDSTGQELFFLGDTVEDNGALLEGIQDYVEGRESYAHWFPGTGAMRFGSLISKEMTRISEFEALPNMSDDGKVATFEWFLELAQGMQ